MQLTEIDFRHLSSEEQTRYREFEKLFGTPGWRRFQKELLERATQIRNGAIGLDTEQALYFAKGQLAVLMGVASYDKGVEYEFANLVAEADTKNRDAQEDAASNA